MERTKTLEISSQQEPHESSGNKLEKVYLELLKLLWFDLTPIKPLSKKEYEDIMTAIHIDQVEFEKMCWMPYL